MIQRLARTFALAIAAATFIGGSCSGGGGGGGGPGGAPSGCDGGCRQVALTVPNVEQIVALAVSEAAIRGVNATVAVVDRVGNVLAVFQMFGANPSALITTQRGVTSLLEGLTVPSTLAAISKAGTAAYLSTQSNAFTTRTANQILQENFNPGESGRPGGPLFGVQISQLLCGDFVKRFDVNALEGPKALPLGFSADPGGLPLYVNGVPVGGVGVELDGVYGIDSNVFDFDSNAEEAIATAGTMGRQAPSNRRADRIAVDGRFLRFADDEVLQGSRANLLAFGALPGALVPVPRFFGNFLADGITPTMPPTVQPGVLFLDPLALSGVVRSDSVYGTPAEVLVTNGIELPLSDSVNPLPAAGGLTATEVRTLIGAGLRLSARARAQIRLPDGSAARVNLSVVDLDGTVLGFGRSPDAPVFGIDVSLQKARTAAFVSSTTAAADLAAATDPLGPTPTLGRYVTAVRTFLGDPTALANGIAFSDRAGGSLSRPFFPDGINGAANGPLSRPFGDWSPFTTGLQVDAILPGLAFALCPLVDQLRAFLNTLDPTILPGDPTTCPAIPSQCTAASLAEVANGFQIFPGSVPIFRGNQLIGGIGVSGDGVDQDDLVAFAGLGEAGVSLGGAIANAPQAIRADNITVQGVRLPYVRCPVAPFLDSSAQAVCQ